jgi:MTH538 TIR-like domain (DUF1863)
MARPRVFVSFDYDHDYVLKEFLVGQAKHEDTPFSIVDASVKEHLYGDWKAKVRARIRNADQVVVICGQHTETATGVNEELRIAQEERKPYFLLWGYKDVRCTKPRVARPDDKIYKWTWDNLKALFAGQR